MATMIPVKFGDVMLQISDGATPTPSWDEICGITAYTHNININTNTEDLPDCESPDAVSFEAPFKISVGESIDFSGFVTPENLPYWRDLAYEEDDTMIRLVFAKGSLTGYFEGPAIMTAAQLGSWERRASGTQSGTLTFTAKPTWTAT